MPVPCRPVPHMPASPAPTHVTPLVFWLWPVWLCAYNCLWVPTLPPGVFPGRLTGLRFGSTPPPRKGQNSGRGSREKPGEMAGCCGLVVIFFNVVWGQPEVTDRFSNVNGRKKNGRSPPPQPPTPILWFRKRINILMGETKTDCDRKTCKHNFFKKNILIVTR